MSAFRFALSLSLLALQPLQLASAAAPATVTATIELQGVRSDAGRVMVVLCEDGTGFPGACRTHAAGAQAAPGTTRVTLADVPAGRYALQAFHDENGNGRPDIPPEGFAFGNGATWPPSFDAAAVEIGGTAPVRVTISYPGPPPAAPMGSRGVEAPDGVERIDVRDAGLYGELYLPKAADARTRGPVLLIGGSEGGVDIISRMAVTFARAGHPALALAYWNEQGLPSTLERIPLEYFDRAIAWLGARSATGAGLTVVGWSRGAEAALLIAGRNPRVGGVVAVAPSSHVWEGMGPNGAPAARVSAWTAGGRDLPHLRPDASAFRPDRPSLLPVFEAALQGAMQRPDTAIPVERIAGRVLLISGGDDQLWPASRFARSIATRLREAGRAARVEHLDYPGAGHFVFVGAPDGPMAQSAVSGGIMGGTAAADAAAWADNWPRTLAFVQRVSSEGEGR